jgi:hypothetical protein
MDSKNIPSSAVNPDNCSDIETKSNQSTILKRIANASYPERNRIFCGISALAINSATNLYFPYIMGKAVDFVSLESCSNGSILLQSFNIYIHIR